MARMIDRSGGALHLKRTLVALPSHSAILCSTSTSLPSQLRYMDIFSCESSDALMDSSEATDTNPKTESGEVAGTKPTIEVAETKHRPHKRKKPRMSVQQRSLLEGIYIENVRLHVFSSFTYSHCQCRTILMEVL